MKQLKVITIFSTLIFFVLFSSPLTVLASEGDVDFSVQAVLPDNQIHRDKTYFDLLMKPKTKQQLVVNVFNSSKKEATFEGEITFATTNQNGLVDYSTSDIAQADESLKTPLSTIAKITNPSLTIPSGESKQFKIDLEMPDESYDGVILGSIHVIKKVAEKKDEKNDLDSGIKINNEYAYVVGIQLTESRQESVSPDLHLKYIEPRLVNYRTAVVANIQNSEAALLEDFDISAEVYKDGSKTPLKTANKENLDMAPNSNFDYPIEWDNQKLEPGDYILKMKATSSADKWEWERKFSIGNDAELLNGNAVEITKNYSWVYVLIFALICFLFLMMMYKKKRGES